MWHTIFVLPPKGEITDYPRGWVALVAITVRLEGKTMPAAAKDIIDAMTTDEKVRTVRYIVTMLGEGFRHSFNDSAAEEDVAAQLSECSRFCRENPKRMSHAEVFSGLQEIIDAGRQVYS